LRYSLLSLARQAVRGHQGWSPAWRNPELQTRYDAVIIGGGGHGLAAAYYLAKEFGISRVAVLERGWIGGGNTGRNTTNVRSDYLYPESAALYEFALRRYEDLSQELNFNIMLSQRGWMMLIHDRHQLELAQHRVNALVCNGIDAEILSREDVARMVPYLAIGPAARYPVLGAFLQRRGGTARHDAVAWAFARGADRLGVDILQNCEVTGFERVGNRVVAVETTRGRIHTEKIGVSAAGHSSVLAGLAGFTLPITSFCLQAMVSEPMKPILDHVVISPNTGIYVNQSDKGELVFGGALDLYTSYGQRGTFPTIEHVVAGCVEMFPEFGHLRLLRHWAGLVDVSPDSSPIIGATPVENLFINCGWGTGGFKATPAGGYMLAHAVARGEPHPLAAPFGLDRFRTNRLIDEGAASGIAH